VTDILNRAEVDHTASAAETPPPSPWTVFLHDDTDLSMEYSRLISHYLDARVAFEEEDTPDQDVADAYAKLRGTLVHLLVAMGAYTDDDAAGAALDDLTAPGVSARFVTRWAYREGLDVLDHMLMGRIAARVEDLVAEGARLDDLGMADLAEPYLTGGAS
jgi:hypothetical protein